MVSKIVVTLFYKIDLSHISGVLVSYHYRLFFLLSLFSFLWGASIPLSEEELESLLSSGVVDSSIYSLWQELSLKPINPTIDGWEVFRQLNLSFSEEQFPSQEELFLYAPFGPKERESLYKKYPLLKQLEPFVIFPSENIIQRGKASLNSRSYDNLERIHMLGRVHLHHKKQELFLSFSQKFDTLSFDRRYLAHHFSKDNKITVGNFSLPSNPLIWGRGSFASLDSLSSEEELLFGNYRGWNGLLGEWKRGSFSAQNTLHYRGENEQFYQSEIGKDLFSHKISIGHISQKKERSHQTLLINGSDKEEMYGALILWDIDSETPAVRAYLQRAYSDIVLWGELFYMSDLYGAPFSSLLSRTKKRYGNLFDTYIGINSYGTWSIYNSFLKVALEREVVSGGVAFEASLLYRYKKKISFTTRNTAQRVAVDDSTATQSNHFLFYQYPIAQKWKLAASESITLKEYQWYKQRETLSLKYIFRKKGEIEFRTTATHYRSSLFYLEGTFLAKQRLHKGSFFGFHITFPLYNNYKGVRLYGNVTFAY